MGESPSHPAAEDTRATEVRFHHSPSFPGVLQDAGCSLLVSTYQAGQLIGVGAVDDHLTFSFRRFDRAMGVALGKDKIALAGREQVWLLPDDPALARAMAPEGRHDACWLPRTSVVTGPIHCHEIAWGAPTADGGDDLWLVNTLFSCLAGIDARHSFVPRWRPPFVSALAAQDRCHLNGVAMRDGSPAFVSAFARADEPAGWREAPADRGLVVDVASGEPVTTGLTMPHSPRWHDGRLLVLNSGLGLLELVDLADGRREAVAAVPGYARGLALHGGLAFVGLSRIRETATFGRSPIAAYHDQLRCGIGVVDLASGVTVATLQFANAVEEIFDVQVVPGVRCPTFGLTEEGGDEVWVLPGDWSG